MPTFTSIALDRLLELDNPNDNREKKQPSAPKVLLPTKAWKRPIPLPPRRRVATAFPSPALYKTPETTPVPDSPSSFPPSPYVVNHKRRGPRLLKAQKNDVDGGGAREAANGTESKGSRGDGGGSVKGLDKDATFDEGAGGGPAVVSYCDGLEERVGLHSGFPTSDSVRADGLSDHPVEYRVSISVSGDARTDDGGATDASQKFQASMNGEFFDAYEVNHASGRKMVNIQGAVIIFSWTVKIKELSSDGASTPVPNSLFDLDKDLHEMRMNLLMEIERRKQVEQALSHMKSQWRSVAEQLSLAGIPFPATPATLEESDELQELDSVEELYQQIFVARFVSTMIGRGCARAEIEQEMESKIESKNFEISRLKDRVQYYEAVNHEMSQRNQEVVEMARRERHRRKRRQRWILGLIGLAVSVGTTGLAWTYLTSDNEDWRSMLTCGTLGGALEKEAT